MTRGQDGSLLPSCVTLAFTTPRRFIPAHSAPCYLAYFIFALIRRPPRGSQDRLSHCFGKGLRTMSLRIVPNGSGGVSTNWISEAFLPTVRSSKAHEWSAERLRGRARAAAQAVLGAHADVAAFIADELKNNTYVRRAVFVASARAGVDRKYGRAKDPQISGRQLSQPRS